MFKSFFFFFVIITLSGCSKEYDNYPFSRVNIPATGTIRDIAIIDENNWLVSGGDETVGFVLKTNDNGISWKKLNEPFDNAVNSLYFINSDTGFAADADILIYKTENGGESWYTYYSNAWPLTVNRNLRDIWFTNDSTGFVCGGKNLGNGVMYHTTNGGDFWAFSEYEHEYRGICFTDELTGVMCGYGSLLRTTDGGATFSLTDNYGAYYTGVCKNSSNDLFICDFNGSIIKSTDKGITWKTIRDGSVWNTKGSYLNAIDISSNGKIVAVGPNGFLTWSSDGGNSWNDRTTFNRVDILSVKWKNNNEVIAVGKKGGVFLLAF